MRIHPAICPRETLPCPLLVPLPLSPLSFYSFHLIFIPSCSHLLFSAYKPSSVLLVFSILYHHTLILLFVSVAPLASSFFFSASCLSLPWANGREGVFVFWCRGHECEGVTVLRPETFKTWSIGNDTEGDPWLVTLETNFIKMNLSRGAILTAA